MKHLLEGLRAAGEDSRLRLLALCARGELTVSELTHILGQSQPRVSRHLKLLCDSGLLHRFREGSWVFFRIADTGANAELARAIVAMIPQNDPIYQRDSERLEEIKATRADVAAAYFRDNAKHWNEIRRLHVPERRLEQVFVDRIAGGHYRDLVDIGTGTGRILEVLAPYVERGIGIDQSHEMLSIARSNLEKADLRHCYVRLADMYTLPFEDNSIDLITIHQVLHFADEPGRVVGEAARLLHPGGRMVVADFAPHELEYLRKDQAHRRLGFSDDEVTSWFRACGLICETPVRLDGDPLTLMVWCADRPGARQLNTTPLKETAA
ncbi:MAG: metalloregulator ArsR/SmtB family transcription factor [Proteobacteria bacterium]|nr:metalloregulator ArsR/SmtB family transcription factor [Pseudomonadota bacterium]